MNRATEYPCTLADCFPFSGPPYTGSGGAIVAALDGKRYAMGASYNQRAGVRAKRLTDAFPKAVFSVYDMGNPANRAMTIDGNERAFFEAASEGFREVQVPFSGFYESWHTDAIDRSLEMAFTCCSGGTVHSKLHERAIDAVSWRAVYLAYGQAYATDWCGHLDIESARWKAMESPQFYNFQTDRLFVEIAGEELAAIYRDVCEREDGREALARLSEERHTSRSGFHSFYSPDTGAWGDFADWDHNQLCTLLLAYWEIHQGESYADSDYEVYYGGELDSNGCLDNMIFNEHADPEGIATRAANVAYLVRQRAERGEEKSEAAFDSPAY